MAALPGLAVVQLRPTTPSRLEPPTGAGRSRRSARRKADEWGKPPRLLASAPRTALLSAEGDASCQASGRFWSTETQTRRGSRRASPVDPGKSSVVDTAQMRAAARSSHVYALEPDAGAVRFGNGRHGARPPTGALVRVRYRSGAGAGGNWLITWGGRWPPRATKVAANWVPRHTRINS